MARNGSGAYSLPAGNPVVTGTTISSVVQNNTMTDIGTALTQSLAYDGQTNPVANLPMAGFKHTGVANAAARTDYASAGQVQDSSLKWAGTAGGTANALTLTLSPAITAIAAGQRFAFKSGASPNSAATTVAISGLTAIAVQVNGAACTGGEILANSWYEILVNTTTTCQLNKIGRATLAELGAAKSGANSDITSLAGLTTALSIAQGGTGATSAAAALTALGAASSANASTSAAGIVPLATSAEAVTGTDALKAITPATMKGGLNASGTAPTFAARAWVNFDGATGTIRASGNVTSVTRNGVGDYTINFTTAMPDANYCVSGSAQRGAFNDDNHLAIANATAPTTTAVRVVTVSAAASQDSAIVTVVIHR